MIEGITSTDLLKLSDEDKALYRYCHSDNLFYTYPEEEEEEEEDYYCYYDDFEDDSELGY